MFGNKFVWRYRRRLVTASNDCIEMMIECYNEIRSDGDRAVHKFIVVRINSNYGEPKMWFGIQHVAIQHRKAVEKLLDCLPPTFPREVGYRFFVLHPDFV